MIILDILCGLALIAFGFAIGGLITVKYLEKSMDELTESYYNVVKTQNDIMKVDNKLIKEYGKLVIMYKSVIGKAYNSLVDLRDSGTEDLDEVIGLLGEALDDHKED